MAGGTPGGGGMTTLATGKPVRRETATYYRRRALVVELHPRTLVIREKGRRDRLEVDYQAVYELACKMRWRAAQAERRAKRRR